MYATATRLMLNPGGKRKVSSFKVRLEVLTVEFVKFKHVYLHIIKLKIIKVIFAKCYFIGPLMTGVWGFGKIITKMTSIRYVKIWYPSTWQMFERSYIIKPYLNDKTNTLSDGGKIKCSAPPSWILVRKIPPCKCYALIINNEQSLSTVLLSHLLCSE